MIPPRIVLVYIEAGGGHRAAAAALSEALRLQRRPWDIQLMSLQDVIDPIDFVRRTTGIRSQDVYNIMLRRGWTRGTAQLIPLMHGIMRAAHDKLVDAFRRHWLAAPPDLVVSLIPHYNRAMREALGLACPGAAYATALTDIADYPPNFWIEPMDQWVICGSERAAAQAHAIGLPSHRILRTSGMIVHPRFYGPFAGDRSRERARLGLNPDWPTGLVLFGGEGSAEMLRIATALNRRCNQMQLILICGRDREVAESLRALPQRIPMLVEGFTHDIPHYMGLSDYFVGKPGPGCISEALVKGLPVVVQRNAATMAHERYNAEWIEDHGIGIVVSDFATDLAGAIRRLGAPETYRLYRDRAEAVRNFAVFEIPGMLAAILEHSARTRAAAEAPRAEHGRNPLESAPVRAA
jgi:hypothetical protein